MNILLDVIDSSFAICIRLELRAFARLLGRHPTTAQRLDLVGRRRRLRKTIEAFTRTAVEFMDEDVVNSIYEEDNVVVDEIDPEDRVEDQAGLITGADPDGQLLPFPSSIPGDYLAHLTREQRDIIKSLRGKELEIRQGHAEDCLESVRGAVIQLSWQFKNKVRGATGIAQKTKSWDGVNLLKGVLKLQRHLYNLNRNIMFSFGDRTILEPKYPYLSQGDCRTSTTITDPNAPGQSSARLAWIWSSGRIAPDGSEDSAYYVECKYDRDFAR